MNKILMFFAFLFFVFSSFGQSNTNTVSQDVYLLKSKKQKKTGIILLVGGAVFVATALIIPKGDPTGDLALPYLQKEYENDGIKAGFGVAGVAAALASVPFFISSNKNKKKAMKTAVSFNSQKLHYLRHNSLFARTQPGFTLKVAL